MAGTPFNGTDFMNDPVFYWFHPYMHFFESITGQAGMFFVFLIMIFAIGIYIKTKDIVFTAMWIISSSGTISAGSYMMGVPAVSILFGIICAIGFVSLILNLLLHMKR